MCKLRVSKGFYLKAYNIPVNTFKSVCFSRLKNKFSSILITQTANVEDTSRCIHHIAIKNEFRVSLQKLIICSN